VLNAATGIDPQRIFAGFHLAPRRAVVAAVSGGSDSLALLFLLADFLTAHAPATRLVAVTVDHGLRAGSADEAANVAALCATHRIAHRILRWTGDKPAHGVPAAAREARYRLLADAARAENTDVVLTGHTLEDQIETVAMREVRGDGRGLSGMAPATLYDGKVWILRPLLDTQRAALRAYLQTRGIGWVDDPTNSDSKYERARVRVTAAADRGVARLRLAAAAAERVDLGRAAAGLIRRYGASLSAGLWTLAPAFSSFRQEAEAIYALRILLATAGGHEQLPDLTRSAELCGRLDRTGWRATLSGALLDARRAATFIRREHRNLPEPCTPEPGAIWDGRFRIVSLPPGTELAPLGPQEIRTLMGSPASLEMPNAPTSLVRTAFAAEPGLWRDSRLLDLATAHGLARRIIAPWSRFLPSFDLAPAHAIADMIGADAPPEPPLASPNPPQP
jgi:tRNA(Ile)-lysidine synthase